MKINFVEDSEKVGFGGGQRVTDLLCRELQNDVNVALFDLNPDASGTYNNIEPQKELAWRSVGWIPHVVKVFASLLLSKGEEGKNVYYACTKKAMLLVLLVRILRPGSIACVHFHNVSSSKKVNAISRALANVFFDKAFFPSSFTLDEIGVRRSKSVVAGNPVEIEAIDQKQREGLTVAFVGRPDHTKGFDVFCDFAERLKDKDLNFVAYCLSGNAPESGGSPFVTMRYDLSPSEIFGQIDLLLVLSRAKETFSLTTAEALVAGKTVIAVDVGALKEVIGESDNGFVCEGYQEVYERLVQIVNEGGLSSRISTKQANARLVKTPAEFSCSVLDAIRL